jgi:hypothetical protein
MAATKRAQVLMEPAEYARLAEMARQGQVSVAELIRSAVRERYLAAPLRRRAAEEILSISVRIGRWELVEKQIAEAHGGRVHR